MFSDQLGIYIRANLNSEFFVIFLNFYHKTMLFFVVIEFKMVCSGLVMFIFFLNKKITSIKYCTYNASFALGTYRNVSLQNKVGKTSKICTLKFDI